ncbi:hypothetical protein K1719_023434 [Acacia pycnantha]|nr:hypothetical protein K1719_023434 [Acacia pycnantha]
MPGWLVLGLSLVPFVLTDGGRRSHADYAIVNLEGSRYPLPLTTVYHKLQPTNASPYTFSEALFGNQYPNIDQFTVACSTWNKGVFKHTDLRKKHLLNRLDFGLTVLFLGMVAKCCFVPALLGHVIDDDFIRPHHADHIFEAYMIPNHVAVKIALELKKVLIDNSLLDVYATLILSQFDLEADLFKEEEVQKDERVRCGVVEKVKDIISM